MRRNTLELECDAPPYYIVQACAHVGVEHPEDVRWLETSHYLARQGLRGPRSKSKRWNQLFDSGEGGRLMCSCGAQPPELSRYKFTFNDGASAFYSFGQCPRCKTVYWHRG